MAQQEPNQAPTKKPWASKINIAALLTFVAGLLSYLAGDEYISQHPQVVSIMTSTAGVVLFVLRTWFTNTKVRL